MLEHAVFLVVCALFKKIKVCVGCLLALNKLSIVCIIVSVFPELEEALGLKSHNALSVENESSKRKVSVTPFPKLYPL